MHYLIVVCCIYLISIAAVVNVAFAEQLTFGLVAKRVDDSNFIDAWLGCNQEASKTNDTCELIGEDRLNSPRFQMLTINEQIKKRKLDALAISVTNSHYIAQRLTPLTIPIITFDSPFKDVDAHISDSYVGVDNIAFGADLAKLAKRLRPDGGTLCIMTANDDTNLQQRVLGLRRGLSNNVELADNVRLTGQGGWSENLRCPWNTGDNEQRALEQLRFTLDTLQPDLLVSVGGWPLINPVNYRTIVMPNNLQLNNRKTMVIVGVGKIQADYRALMNDGLLHACLSIDFVEMGSKVAKIMRDRLAGKPLSRENYVPTISLIADDLKTN